MIVGLYGAVSIKSEALWGSFLSGSGWALEFAEEKKFVSDGWGSI